MRRCLQLAQLGAGRVAPNPMVGCVIVHRDKIIGEGFHRDYGQAHAEVNAVNAVKNQELLRESTLYVSLEPCAHHGLTPPCSEMIIKKKIPKVVIGAIDPFDAVAGKGVEKLQKAGVEVTTGVLEKECRELNRRFYTFHQEKRPYVILKWAQTIDGFIDIERSQTNYGQPTWITGDLALRLVHKIRSEENAILVGRKTAEKDNPSLTVRHWPGHSPVRLLIDKNLQLPQSLNLFDNAHKTFVFNAKKNAISLNLYFVKIDFEKNIINQITDFLYREKILSVIVEGGKQLLESFIEAGLWDEAHVFTGNKFFSRGIKAPPVSGKLIATEKLDNDVLHVFRNLG